MLTPPKGENQTRFFELTSGRAILRLLSLKYQINIKLIKMLLLLLLDLKLKLKL
jgi:hypothetical protein